MTADDIEAGMLPESSEAAPSRAQWADNDQEMNQLWRLLLDELSPTWQIAVVEDVGQTRLVRWGPDEEPEAVDEAAGRRFWSPADDPPR